MIGIGTPSSQRSIAGISRSSKVVIGAAIGDRFRVAQHTQLSRPRIDELSGYLWHENNAVYMLRHGMRASTGVDASGTTRPIMSLAAPYSAIP